MKNGGQILWNVTPICETSQICYPMERRPMRLFGQTFKNRSFHLVHWLSITLQLRRTSQESINLERKYYLDCSSDTLLHAGGIWKGDVLIADLEELETMDASEIYSKKTQCERGDISQTKGEFIFPIADGPNQNLLEVIKELRTSTLTRDRPIQGESHESFF